ncbi:hypothetical protein [Microbacterium testaceum]|uniref:hypothetical protein n=1 Tax=Microbacterium testaceum TaxID=2033 RepID=UPI0025AFF151|nr:hypothetical protein [Microbacterium testaceum]WJS91828.1 hypothetical protein NYQ11_04540 [Microbacterium testaceum]
MSMLLATAGSMPASPRGARSTGEGAATTATRTIFADALAHAAVSRDDAAGPVLPAEPVTAAADTLDASADGSDDRPAEPAPSSGSEATAFGAEAVTGMAIPASMAVRTDVVPAVGSSASHTAATEPIAAAVAGEPFAQTPPAAAGAPETRPLVGVPLAGIASDGARPAADGREDAALVALAAGNGAERSSDPTTCAAVTADTRANAALPTSARPGAAVASPARPRRRYRRRPRASSRHLPGSRLRGPRRHPPPRRSVPFPGRRRGTGGHARGGAPGGVVVTGLALAAAPEDAPARHEAAPSVAATAGPSGVAATPPLSTSAPLAPAPAETAAPTSAQRSIAAQVAPAIVHIAQRPAGTHRITLTITPEATGPVTVRAHIGPGGEVRIDLAGATEAGRDALRAMVADLRRDLAAVNPHAHLSVGSPLSADAGTGDRGAPSENGSDPSDRGRGSRPDDTAPSASTRPAARLLPALSHVVPGGGLDILV